MLTIDRLPEVSFLEELPPVRVQTDTPFIFQLIYDSQTTVLNESYSPAPDGGAVEIDIRKVLRGLLTYKFPKAGTADTVTGTVLNMSFIIETTSRSSQDFTVIAGGDPVLRPRLGDWLTLQSQTKVITQLQPEWLSIYFTEQMLCELWVTFYYSDGSDIIEPIYDYGHFFPDKYYTIDVSYECIRSLVSIQDRTLVAYDVTLCEVGGIFKLSRTQRYILDRYSPEDRYFICINSLGGWDTHRFRGAREYIPEVEYTAVLRGGLMHQGAVDIRHVYSQNTGYLAPSAARCVQDLLSSRQVYKCEEGEIRPIVITESSVEMVSSDILRSAQFKYIYQESKALSAARTTMDDLPVISLPHINAPIVIAILNADTGSTLGRTTLASSGQGVKALITSSLFPWKSTKNYNSMAKEVWCHVSPSSGEQGQTEITVSADAYTGRVARETEVTVTAVATAGSAQAILSVKQEGKAEFITVTSPAQDTTISTGMMSVFINGKSNSQIFVVTARYLTGSSGSALFTNYAVHVNSVYCTREDTSAEIEVDPYFPDAYTSQLDCGTVGEETQYSFQITIPLPANTGADERTWYIRFANYDGSVYTDLRLVQPGGGAAVTTTPTSVTIDDTGAQESVSVESSSEWSAS